MIRNLKLLQNIGQFDSVDSAATISLARLVLIYAENGRGKTTLAAVLRSLAIGDPTLITERRRLAAEYPPHVVLDCDGGPPAVFQDGVWSRTLSDLVVFDDLFVDQNVYSGLAVEAGHRHNLHELVLGVQGVALSRRLQELVKRIEEHNRALRDKTRAIPNAELGGLSVDDFCGLEARPEIEREIQETERVLAAAREQEPVRNTPFLEGLTLPAFDLDSIYHILAEDLPTLDAAAAARVQEHVATLGAGGEQWIGEGIRRMPQPEPGNSAEVCPFCAQDLGSSPVIAHYRAYFSEVYTGLKRRIDETLAGIERTHGGEVSAGFERAVRMAGERCQFWSRFCEVPEVEIDTATIVRDWSVAREAVAAVLRRKQAAPLEPMVLDQAARYAVATYESHRQRIAALSSALSGANEAINVVKEQTAGADVEAIDQNLTRLRVTRSRHTPEIAALCDDYLAEKAAKACTEEKRKQAQFELDGYRTNVFPVYETAINLYLQRFNAGFRLDSVTSASTRGGPTCTYNVVINNTPIPVAGRTAPPGEPSFRNTLSSGDRNTLALSFFFASLDQDTGLANKVVVIDDPISSLDDHRSLTTVQQTRALATSTEQVIVLSHNKRFLCRIWDGANASCRTALKVVRQGKGSAIQTWNVDHDSVTEHDLRHALLRDYLGNGTQNPQEIAKAIRPLLESFLRVACPEHFPPETLLGPFHWQCAQKVGSAQEILDANATRELGEVKEYAKRFHHDTNPAWETEPINEGELRGFVERALNFARR